LFFYIVKVGCKMSIMSKKLTAVILILLAIGLLSSLYLTHLYLEVHNITGQPVSSFCAVSEGFNCVTVANSDYALFFGVPVALIGVEYFLFLIVLTIAGGLLKKPVSSYLLWATLLAWPGCFALAMISTYIIQSVCLLCCTVYAVCIILPVILLIKNNANKKFLLMAAPLEIFSLLFAGKKYLLSAIVIGVVALSQFFWVPPLFCSDPCKAETFQSKDGGYLGLPVDGIALGNKNAHFKIEEFTDIQCPFCGKAHQVIMELISNHPELVYHEHHDYPLDHHCNVNINRPFHQNACRAAMFGKCAAKQNLFRPLVETMFSHRRNLSDEELFSYAESIEGLDIEQLKSCLEDPQTLEAIQKDIALGAKRGMRGTPTFFVNGKKIVGFKQLDFWEKQLEKTMQEKKKKTNN